MPRITPYRGLKFILFIYTVVIGLWITLPTRQVPSSELDRLVQKWFASGSLVTAHKHIDYMGEFASYLPSTWRTDGYAFLMQWQLRQVTASQSRVGDPYVAMDIGGAHYNLKDTVAAAQDFNAKLGYSNDTNSANWIPFFGDFLGPTYLPMGDTNSLVNMPWWPYADKAFLALKVSRLWATLYPRFVVPMPGVLQLWNDGLLNATLGNDRFEQLRRFNCVSYSEWGAGSSFNPSCSNVTERVKMYEDTWARLRDAERDAGLLVTFKASEMKSLGDVMVDELRGEFPSKTYPFRYWLLVILTPVIAIVYFLRYGVYDASAPVVFGVVTMGLTMVILYVAIVAACWVEAGRPKFAEWSSEFILTRGFHRREAKSEGVGKGRLLEGGLSERKGRGVDGGPGRGEEEGKVERSDCGIWSRDNLRE